MECHSFADLAPLRILIILDTGLVHGQEQGDDAILILDDSRVPEEVREYLLARDASAVMMIQEELFAGRIPLSSLEVRLPPRSTAPFEAVFGLTPVFDRPRSQARVG